MQHLSLLLTNTISCLYYSCTIVVCISAVLQFFHFLFLIIFLLILHYALMIFFFFLKSACSISLSLFWTPEFPHWGTIKDISIFFLFFYICWRPSANILAMPCSGKYCVLPLEPIHFKSHTFYFESAQSLFLICFAVSQLTGQKLAAVLQRTQGLSCKLWVLSGWLKQFIVLYCLNQFHLAKPANSSIHL